MSACYFIPELASQAGSSLTAQNWQELGVEIVSYSLAALLMKPGLECLKNLPNLATYIGWDKSVVIDASMLEFNKQGQCVIRSVYDGTRSQYTAEELLGLINQLQPQFVLLPRQLNPTDWLTLSESILPFFHAQEKPVSVSRSYGVYFMYEKKIDFQQFKLDSAVFNRTASNRRRSSLRAAGEAIQNDAMFEDRTGLLHCARKDGLILNDFMAYYKNCGSEFKAKCNVELSQPLYIIGDLEPKLIQQLLSLGITYFQSDKPAQDACNGLIYAEQDFSIKMAAETLNFDLLSEMCGCPTCQQHFTRAYLYHLLQHTPLLCQRFLIQHNVFHACHLRRDEMSL